MGKNDDEEDHHDGPSGKSQGSRPRALSSDHGDSEQSDAKRPRFGIGATLRQSRLPFQPIAKSKSEGHKPKATEKEESDDDVTTSKFFPGRGRTLGESSRVKKTSSASDYAAKHSKKDSSPAWGSPSSSKPTKGWTRKTSDYKGGKSKQQGASDDGSFAARKDRLKAIAASTLEAIDNGLYECDGITYDLKDTVQWMNDHTVFYAPKSELDDWNKAAETIMDVDKSSSTGPSLRRREKETQISLMQFTTLEGSRWMHAIATSVTGSQSEKPRIGVLNFASAKKPGGGFINGARAQEESIARSSTIYASLMIPTGQKFYKLHHADAKGGFYTHAMIYSPRVQLIKDDAGKWLEPIEVDIVTSPAVNAGDVRNKYSRKHRQRNESGDDAWKQGKGGEWSKNKEKKAAKQRAKDEDDADSGSEFPEAKSKEELEQLINEHMYERMARILYLCQLQSIPNLVLGSFGTGVFRNDVETVAELWMRLLVGEDAPFRGVFDRVLFAIMDKETVFKFANVFGDFGIEVTSARQEGSQQMGKGKGRPLEEVSSTDVSMQDMSQEWKIL